MLLDPVRHAPTYGRPKRRPQVARQGATSPILRHHRKTMLKDNG